MSCTLSYKRSDKGTSCPACPACPSPGLPPTINHHLFHTTTRTPLYVHPCLWSAAHLTLLGVTITAIPAPKRLAPNEPTVGSLCEHTLIDILDSYEYPYPPYVCVMNLLASAIDSLAYHTHITYEPLPLHAGPTTTYLHPYVTIARNNGRSPLPFISITSPGNREAERSWQKLSQRIRCPPPSPDVPVHPADVALLIAMAQEQYRMFPLRGSYIVYVLTMDEGGRHVIVLEAEVTQGFVLAVREPERVLTDGLEVGRAVVKIEGRGRQYWRWWRV